MKKKAFTILELLVVIAVSTILLLMVLYAYKQFVNVKSSLAYQTKFNNLFSKMELVYNKPDRILAETLTPRYITKLDPDLTDLHEKAGDLLGANDLSSDSNILWQNTEKILNSARSSSSTISNDFFNSIYNFTIIDPTNPEKMANQLSFWGLTRADVTFPGHIYPLLFIQNGYGYTPEGIKFPYKMVNLIVMDNELYRHLKYFIENYRNNPEEIRNLFNTIFSITQNGVHVKYNLDINNDDPNFVQLMKDWLGSNYKSIWSRNKYTILVKTLTNANVISNIVSTTYKKMYSIKKNLEDWAVIQARIAAYDSTNGNNMDKDYFITAGNNDLTDYFFENGNVTVDKTKTLLPKSTASTIVEGSTSSTDQIDETNLNNGIFICQNGQLNTNQNVFSDVEKFYCNNQNIAYLGNAECSQNLLFNFLDPNLYNNSNGIMTTFLVNIAYPNNVTQRNLVQAENGQVSLGCTLDLAMRKLLASTKFTENFFGIPIMFSDSGGFIINISNYLLSPTDSNGIYKEDNSIPTNVSANPPYTAKLVTFFPWMLGGIEPESDPTKEPSSYIYPNSDTEGYGVISLPIFAHVF